MTSRYTAAQTARYDYLKKKYPFKKDTPAQFKAWEKAHPFPKESAALSQAEFAEWESKHPFKGQKPVQLTPAELHALHEAHLKHLAHLKTTGRTAAAAKARSLSPGDVGCCTAEAVAACLRLQGVPFTDADILSLFWRAGSHPDRGIPLADMLHASGLMFSQADLDAGGDLILGLDLPGPHAVLATADGWWSWGELHCPCEFPDAVIEEAWAVSVPGGAP
jgi:hypothetical protein